MKKKVTILPSLELYQTRLEGLVGKQGVVAEKVFGQNGASLGAWVRFEQPYKNEVEWFIPNISLRYE